MGAKEDALKRRCPEDKVMYTENFSKYSFCNNYEELMGIIKKQKIPRICEYIFEALPVNFFYDIDIKKAVNPKEFENYKEIVQEIIDKTTSFFDDRGISVSVIVLKSHSNKKSTEQKKSFHMIFRAEKQVFTIPCCISIANFLFADSDYMMKGIIDKSVFREGNFRSYLCSKKDEVRPFIRCKSFGSEEFDDVDTFIQYYSDDATIWTETDLSIPVNQERVLMKGNEKGKVLGKRKGEGKEAKGKAKKVQTLPSSSLDLELPILHKFILEKYGFAANNLSSCKKKDSGYFFNVNTKYCHAKGRDHKSNGQFIYVNPIESAQMCHDKVDCGNFKHNCILSQDYPDELRSLFPSIDGREEAELKAKEDCKEIVFREYDENKNLEVSYDKQINMFSTPAATRLLQTVFTRGHCPGGCKIEHQIFQKGYHIKCSMCNTTFPNSSLITWNQDTYPSLHKYFISIVNNTTIINNNYNSAVEDDFGCEVAIDPNIFNDQKFTDIVNQILDGHKICDVARLLKTKYDLFVYDKKMKDWYFFNGFRWVPDGSLDFKEKVIEARSVFNDILLFYKDQPVTENLTHLRKNVKSLIKKMSDPGFKGLALEEAKLCFRQTDFSKNLNYKKYLVPFTNGVYDLLDGTFRAEGKKEDYVELTVGYDYDANVNNPAVHDFLQSILPDKSVRDYMLKKLADCLNGDRPNTLFFFLIGVGSNGKTQLMNLMYETMGQFGNKTASSLFTRRRPDSDAPSPSLMSLKDKRFACASETADGERINLALLKEITGSESSIQARRLNENTTEFKMQAKFFLSTNTLPEIHGEGEAVWRRIRVVDFPTKFVESPDPLKLNEKKADLDIQTRIESDLTWKQTFFNILLGYYNLDIPTPEAVLLRTQEYREESNEVEQWVKDNIEFSSGGVLELVDLNLRRFGPDYQNAKVKGKFKKDVEKVLRQLGESVVGFEPICKRLGDRNNYGQKWVGIQLL